jgi:hypothetical protein
MKINKPVMLKFVNPIMAILFISQSVSGLAHSQLSDETFEAVHGFGGKVFIALVIVHIWLNFGWIKNTLLKPILKKA